MIVHRHTTTGMCSLVISLLLALLASGGCGEEEIVTPKSLVASKSDKELSEGLAQLKNHKLDAAVSAFNAAVVQNENNAKAFYYRAVAWDRQSKPLKTLADYTAATNLNEKIARNRPRTWSEDG